MVISRSNYIHPFHQGRKQKPEKQKRRGLLCLSVDKKTIPTLELFKDLLGSKKILHSRYQI